MYAATRTMRVAAAPSEADCNARVLRADYPMDNYAKAGGSYSNYAPEAERAAVQERCCKAEGNPCCGGGCGSGKELDSDGVGVACASGRCDRNGGDEGDCGPGGECDRGHCGGDSEGARSPTTSRMPPPPPTLPSSLPPSPPECGAADESLAPEVLSTASSNRIPPSPKLGAAAIAEAAEVVVSVRGDGAWLEMCAAMEKKCFAKHEAMDIPREAKGRGVTILCAAPLASPATCVGFAVVQRSSLALAVTKLVVAPHMRRRGIGRALLAHAVAIGQQGRAQLCTLHVDESNLPARELYQSMGFAVTTRRADYYRIGRHALAMEMNLLSE